MTSSQKKIIVVDDNPFDTRILSTCAKENGFTPLFASTGPAALPLFKMHSDIALIFLDINLPGMTGLDILENIGQLNKSLLRRVIVVSGAGALETVTKAIRLGAADYLVKPINVDVLNDKIKKTLKSSTDPLWVPSPFTSEEHFKAHFVQDEIKIKSIGEEIVTLESEQPWPQGEIRKVHSALFNHIGCNPVQCLRGESSQKVSELFHHSASYFELSPEDREKIHLYISQGH